MKYFITAFMVLFCTVATAKDFSGKCTSVHDGDTITVIGTGIYEKVRLYGIDSPEIAQTSGTECKKAAEFYVLNKEIYVKDMGRDKYGRMIGVVILDRSTSSSLNAAMLRYGYSWHYKEYSKDENFAEWETLAKNEKRGIWNESPVAPWEYRAEKKRLADAMSSRLVAKERAEESLPQVSKTNRLKTPSKLTARVKPVFVPTRNVQQYHDTNQAYGRQILVGPQGGHYFINKNGNKQYVDRNIKH